MGLLKCFHNTLTTAVVLLDILSRPLVCVFAFDSCHSLHFEKWDHWFVAEQSWESRRLFIQTEMSSESLTMQHTHIIHTSIQYCTNRALNYAMTYVRSCHLRWLTSFEDDCCPVAKLCLCTLCRIYKGKENPKPVGIES